MLLPPPCQLAQVVSQGCIRLPLVQLLSTSAVRVILEHTLLLQAPTLPSRAPAVLPAPILLALAWTRWPLVLAAAGVHFRLRQGRLLLQRAFCAPPARFPLECSRARVQTVILARTALRLALPCALRALLRPPLA